MACLSLTSHRWEVGDRFDSPPPVVYVAPTATLLRPTFTFIPPALPSPAERPPIGGDWIHEIKHDGFSISEEPRYRR
jgi:hypothetical protein